MTDTTTQSQTATATEPRRRTTTPRPQVSVRPVAVGALNAATIAGATAVAAGAGPLLAGAAALGLAGATAAGARKARNAKAGRQSGGSVLGSAGRSSGGRAGATPRAGRSSAATPGGGRAGKSGSGRTAGASRSGGAGGSRGIGSLLPKGRGGSAGGAGGKRGSGSGSTGSGGHRRAGSKTGSSSRSPLTAAKVAAARRKLANKREPGPRLSDAIRSANTAGVGGKKPTARQAFAAARRAVTGEHPKRRGTLRRAAAGVTAGTLAAGKAAMDARKARKKRDAARQAKTDRIERRKQSGVGTTVRRAVNTPDQTSKQKKPAPQPVTRRPRSGSTPAPVTKGTITMIHPLLALSEDFLAAAARNQPEGMLQVTSEAHIMPEVMDNIVKAMKIRFDRAQEQPLHASIKDMYGLVHKAQVSVQQAAEEIGPAIEKAHQDELDRLRNPKLRGDESMWDVSRNRGAA